MQKALLRQSLYYFHTEIFITDGARRIAIYVFLVKDGTSCYVTRSLFRDVRDYTEGQHRFIRCGTVPNKVSFNLTREKFKHILGMNMI